MEARADKEAALATGDAKGYAQYWQTDADNNQKNTFLHDRYGNYILDFEHPPYTERAAYLTAIANQQAAHK